MTIRWTLAVAGLVALPAMVMIGTANNAMAQGRRTDTVTLRVCLRHRKLRAAISLQRRG